MCSMSSAMKSLQTSKACSGVTIATLWASIPRTAVSVRRAWVLMASISRSTRKCPEGHRLSLGRTLSAKSSNGSQCAFHSTVKDRLLTLPTGPEAMLSRAGWQQLMTILSAMFGRISHQSGGLMTMAGLPMSFPMVASMVVVPLGDLNSALWKEFQSEKSDGHGP